MKQLHKLNSLHNVRIQHQLTKSPCPSLRAKSSGVRSSFPAIVTPSGYASSSNRKHRSLEGVMCSHRAIQLCSGSRLFTSNAEAPSGYVSMIYFITLDDWQDTAA